MADDRVDARATFNSSGILSIIQTAQPGQVGQVGQGGGVGHVTSGVSKPKLADIFSLIFLSLKH